MRSQTILSQPSRFALDPARPISAYEAELYARHERARLVGELLAEAIVRVTRFVQRLLAAPGKRAPARI